MEPVEAEVKQKLRIVWAFQTTVRAVIERDKEFWVHLEGSRESMYFGADPGWIAGDKVKVTMEKI